jgi:hypothetical protein
MRRRNRRIADQNAPSPNIAPSNRLAEQATPGSGDSENGMNDRRLQRLADCLVLAILAIDAVLLPPRTDFLSHLWCGPPPMPPGTLGGVLIALSMLLLLIYFVAAMVVRPAKAVWIKLPIIVLFSVFYLVLPALSDITARAKLGIQMEGRYVSFPHDGGVLQAEAAASFLLAGKDPYAANYSETPMAQSHHSNPQLWASLGFKENPAFGFYPYPPLTFLLSLPIQVAWKAAFGWFDQRIIYLVALAVLGSFGYRLPRCRTLGLPFLALLVVNPLYTPFFIEGCNDILCVMLLVITIYALRRDSLLLGGLFLGLACGAKQFAWVMVPFYLAYLVVHARAGRGIGRRLLGTMRLSWPLWAVLAAVFVPFLVWNPAALYHSLIEGNGAIYPFRIESLGFSNLLICFKWVTSPRQEFPTVLFYALLVLPAMIVGLWWTLSRKSLAAMLTSYAATLFLLLYFSRFFAHNYLWLILVVAASALVVDDEPEPLCRQAGRP